eukprot:g6523.t1
MHCAACPKGKHYVHAGSAACAPAPKTCTGDGYDYNGTTTEADFNNRLETLDTARVTKEQSSWLGGAATADGGFLIAIPFDAQDLAVLDMRTGETATVLLPPAAAGNAADANTASEGKWAGAVLAANGRVYAIPHSMPGVLSIDTSGFAGSLDKAYQHNDYGLSFQYVPYEGAETAGWRGGVLAATGVVYGVPFKSRSVLVIVPREQKSIGLNSDVIKKMPIKWGTGNKFTGTADDRWSGGVLAANGAIYCAPSSYEKILKFDPHLGHKSSTEAFATTLNLPLTIVTPDGAKDTDEYLKGDNKWEGGVLASNGHVYFIPNCAEYVLRLKPNAEETGELEEEVSLLSIGSQSSYDTGVTHSKWRGGVVATSGRIYGIPSIDTLQPQRQRTMLRIDPQNENIDLLSFDIDLPEAKGYAWWGGVLAPNGVIFGFPHERTMAVQQSEALHRWLKIGVATCVCGAGYASGVGGCTQCEAGKYKSFTAAVNSVAACAPCGSGRYSGQVAQTSVAACLACSEGRYGNQTAQTSASACAACPTGRSNANTGQSACSDCEKGKYNDQLAATACTACARGRISDQVAQTSASVCEACAAGRFSDDAAQSACEACKEGKYSGQRGLSACVDCAKGQFSDQAAQASCSDCAKGRFSDRAARASCSDCVEGQYQPNAGQHECKSCPSGRTTAAVAETTSDKCFSTKCIPGEGSYATGLATCFPCAPGQVRDTQPNCTLCARGQYQDGEARVACKFCALGKYGRDELGAFSSEHCVDCPAGKFGTEVGLETCSSCLAGKHQDQAGQAFCLTCEAGKFSASPQQRACEACAAGRFGTGVQDSVAHCNDCATGKYQREEATTFCIDATLCVPGTKVSGNLTATSDRACVECTAGRFSAGVNAAACAECEVGRHQASSKQTFCERCSTGKHGSAARPKTSEEDQCVVCEPGTFQPGVGESSCMPCAGGQYQSQQGASACDPLDTCVAGKATLVAGNQTTARECQECAAGRFSTFGLSCTNCPKGKYQGRAGQAECFTCAEGQVCDTPDADTGLLIAPRPCPQGFECASDEVKAACGDEGKIASTYSQCVSCPDLHFVNPGGNNCVKCPTESDSAGRESLVPGVECRYGRIKVRDDFFVAHAHDGRLSLFRCPEYGVCTTNATITVAGNLTINTTCAGNTRGLLCALCSKGFGKAAGRCMECPDASTQKAVMAAFALAGLLLSLAMTLKSLKSELNLDAATISVLRIFVTFMMMTGFLSSLRLDWGSVLRAIFNTARAGSGGVPPLVQCSGVDFASEMTFSLMLPLFVPCVPCVFL